MDMSHFIPLLSIVIKKEKADSYTSKTVCCKLGFITFGISKTGVLLGQTWLQNHSHQIVF